MTSRLLAPKLPNSSLILFVEHSISCISNNSNWINLQNTYSIMLLLFSSLRSTSAPCCSPINQKSNNKNVPAKIINFRLRCCCIISFIEAKSKNCTFSALIYMSLMALGQNIEAHWSVPFSRKSFALNGFCLCQAGNLATNLNISREYEWNWSSCVPSEIVFACIFLELLFAAR